MVENLLEVPTNREFYGSPSIDLFWGASGGVSAYILPKSEKERYEQ